MIKINFLFLSFLVVVACICMTVIEIKSMAETVDHPPGCDVLYDGEDKRYLIGQ